MLVTLPDATTLDLNLKRCSQCGRIGDRYFIAVPTDGIGGPEVHVCSARQACQRRVDKARKTQAELTALRACPAPAEDVPTGRVQDWTAPRGPWTAEQQEDHYRALAIAIGFDPASRDALHPRVRARTARTHQTAA
ncbi:MULTISPECIES: hypothetical protein [unclassified Streptomyces]|uniref:hypothetical protein n=1 Tax=unclassified Streptomyces TaxID=2593676 RepID=UPI00088BB7E3|nr:MULTISPECIES: hypothetical protein [unclassified Streptomyces]PBC72317.1 hypothetical protein BX261_7401 [Streptomyces sp. 2321.6]SDR62187.1 hypothetical protein SAMN05216511_7302 [Streptomyces sp. KS_16]SEE50930.1 hypothetical protein SAMN05428940_7351 [Streptomyces sp. 2133.1]SNC77821.1 hypothetical protein SAMN06272741_7237 [Streptomyces sp. 2114.4]